MGLQEYQRKRNLEETPEPQAHRVRQRTKNAGFVVQLHHARTRHYDFRLEVDGVLRSWAIPKGPSFRPGEKRLAVQVEDHPLGYADFEGTIPPGHYGAGRVAIFDKGVWLSEDVPREALKRGKLDFTLKGKRLKGDWTLVRTGFASSQPQWLLFKRNDEFAGDFEADDLVDSTPRSSAETSRETRKRAVPRPRGSTRRQRLIAVAGALPGARRARASGFVAPMLTTASKTVPQGDDWLHEWKWDGYRLIAATEQDGTSRLWSRNGLSWEHRVPELTAALDGLRVDARLDGELIAINKQGDNDFNLLQHALKTGETSQLRFAVFDLMRLGDVDLAHVDLHARKELLRELLGGADARLFYSAHLQGHGSEMFEEARKRGMEGIISKRATSGYHSGRSSDWLKIKLVETREFTVVGYTPPKGARKGIGAFLLAQLKDGVFSYVGRVGSGLDNELLQKLPEQLRTLETDVPAVPLPPHTRLPSGKVQWLKPVLVIEVVFRGWGKEGLLRQASFLRLRPDRAVTTDLEQPEALPAITSPTRIVYPDIKATKQNVYDYYLDVADRILDEVAGRLLSIVRCPDGILGQRFFQKHAGAGFGESVKRLRIREAGGGEKEYFYIDDVSGLMNLVQMNAIEFHPWGSRVDDLERPDRLIFDLDPDPSIAWKDVKRAARDLRDQLERRALPSYPRLSGGKGVHVVVPISPRADWDEVRRFSEAYASAMAREYPSRYVATMSKAKRQGRIFIDWLRNARGATSIAAWSLRARRGAPTAMLLSWEELERLRRPDRYSLADAASRQVPAFIVDLRAKAPTLPSAWS